VEGIGWPEAAVAVANAMMNAVTLIVVAVYGSSIKRDIQRERDH
jgi:hypothetical protein